MAYSGWKIYPEQAGAYPYIGHLHFCDKKDLILPRQKPELESLTDYLSRNKYKYQRFLRQKSRNPSIDLYAVFQPFNEAFKALFPFISYIKEKVQSGDIILNLWDRSGWTASMLSGWFPDQQIITVWEGDKDILGYKGFDYWMSSERRSNHTVVFTDFLRPMPFESNSISAIIGMDLLHRFNQPELISELNRIARPQAPILFPHVHLTNSEPEPYFDRGCRQLHGKEYDFLFEQLAKTTHRKGYVLSEPATFNWNQDSADKEKILISEPDHPNYNACIAWIPENDRVVLRPWRGHEQPEWEANYLLQNPLLSIHPINCQIEFNIKDYGPLIEELLEHHAVYARRIRQSIGKLISQRVVEILYWAGQGKTLLEILKITGIPKPDMQQILQTLWDLELAQVVPVDEAGFRLQSLLGHQKYILERKEQQLGFFWKQAVESYSEQTCMKMGNDFLNYSQADELVTLIQKALVYQGLKKGDRVLLCADLHPEILLVFWAASGLGIVLVPVSIREAKPRIREYIQLLKPSLAFVQPALHEFVQSAGCNSIMLDLINEPDYDTASSFENWLGNCPDTVLSVNSNITGDDIAVILWTTGSTGNPKGIPLTHGQLIRSGRCMTETYHWKKTDRYLAIGGLETMSGLRHATIASAETGACCIIPEDNKSIYHHAKTIMDEKITILSANPVFYRQLLATARTVENLSPENHLIRLALCTGNTLTEELRTKWQEQTGIQLMNYYGLTETSGLCIAEPKGFSPSADHSIGIPIDCLIKIIDKSGNHVKTGVKGELCIYGAGIFSGYFRNEEATAACLHHDWFHTGDLAIQNEDGSISLYGRLSDIVKLPTGERIEINALDEVLGEISQLTDWAVCPLLEKEKESIALFVVPRYAEKEIELITLVKSAIRKQIGNYAVPHVIEPVKKIPRGNHNKILKKKLLDNYLKAPNHKLPDVRKTI
jgi:acyl-coenzyme A synthetase/AMP-(fatty) acid ligase